MAPERARRLALGAARWALIFGGLFVVRLVLRGPLIAVTPEECHTGGIARELLAHGVRFPLLDYTPEFYENGIVLQGFLAVPFVALLGPTALALKMLSLVVSLLVTMLGLALLERVLDDAGVEGEAGRRVARGAYLLGVLLSPSRFLFEAMDALGDENEAAAMTLLVLLLFFRRVERPSGGRVVALWVAAGWSLFFHKGTLLASSLALAYEAVALLRGRSSARLLGVGLAGAAVGAVPTFLASRRSQHEDVLTILEKFPVRPPGEMAAGLLRSLWGFFDGRLGVLLLVGAGLGWLGARAWRARRLDASLPWLGAYLLLHLAMMAPAHEHADYWYYSYPVLLLALAALAGRARGLGPLARWPSWAAGGAVLVTLCGALRPRLGFDPGLPARLARDRGGACTWRFGRAFLHAEGESLERAAASCRKLGGYPALDCVAGLGFERPDQPFEGSPNERRAYVFGAGRRLARKATSAGYCFRFVDPAERQLCELGGRVECLAYADLYGLVFTATPAPRPSCELPALPVRGFASATVERLMARPAASAPVVLGSELGGCLKVLPACFPEITSLGAASRKNQP